MAMTAALRALHNLLDSKKAAAAAMAVSSDLKIDTGALRGGQARHDQTLLHISTFIFNMSGRSFLTKALVVRAGNRRLMQDIDCGGLCNQRCSLHSRPNVCTRACGTCCVRCKCVPPGTSGNREVCGTCYTDMTTHGNKTKCP
uniref:Snakin-2 n=1 Tax=Salix viminalis TaxID=40686 RepID=A0A6N2LGN3_SALVM